MKNRQTNANPIPGITGEPALKLNKILVPVDFTDGSKKALQYAVCFAKQCQAQIILLHILPSPADMNVEYEDESARRLKAWADEFIPGETTVEIQMCRGAEALEIVNAAKQWQVGLMVISTHGRTGRAHALAGSLAENLVQLAPCPVLVVREHERDFIETRPGKKQAERTPNFLGTEI